MLYQTIVSKDDHINGTLIFSDNNSLPTKHPLSHHSGYNPEQLIGAAWATCLNATIQTLLEAKKLSLQSKVSVTVALCEETEQVGYYFDICATACIEQLPLSDAEEIITTAHKRCPVSKLLQGAKNLRLHITPY